MRGREFPGRAITPLLLEWSYWLLTVGVVIMVSDLTIAGLVEARIWQSSAPWMESVRAARPYWIIRTLSFVPIAAGFVLLLSRARHRRSRRGPARSSGRNRVGTRSEEIAPRLATEVV